MILGISVMPKVLIKEEGCSMVLCFARPQACSARGAAPCRDADHACQAAAYAGSWDAELATELPGCADADTEAASLSAARRERLGPSRYSPITHHINLFFNSSEY